MSTPIRILRDRGIRPRKHLGQSFLQDLNIANKIVDYAHIRPEETVVEIGAGLGVMTDLIAAKAHRVIALDVDPHMIAVLRERLSHFANVDYMQQDVLKYDFSSALPSHEAGKLVIVGNVPYQIASPILFRLLDFRRFLSRILLMLQKEVVDRITARPGTKEYGIPSVIATMFCSMERLLNVPAGCFYPQPKVDSSVLKLGVRDVPIVALDDEALFVRIVRAAFAKRRKTLANNLRLADLRGFSPDAMRSVLQECGIDGTRRAETLTAEEFGRLANGIRMKEMA